MGYHDGMTSRFIPCVVLLLSVFGVVSVTVAGQHVHPANAQVPPQRRAVPLKPHTGPLPALPPVSFAPPRPMAMVRQVYEFAARHPEIVRHVPCYCGCERVGHNGNHDCFVKTRASSGAVTEWDTHGIGCAICVDVGLDAMSLFNAGASASQIRAAIDRKYASHFPSSTPTPRP
jgi:hypothetical protein